MNFLDETGDRWYRLDNLLFTVMDFFEVLRNVIQKNDPNIVENPDFDKVFTSYMLVRYLSMRLDLLPLAQVIQSMQKAGISEKDIYQFAYKNVPYSRNGYIKYIKPSSSDTSKKSKKRV